jgi:hypothetical protein
VKLPDLNFELFPFPAEISRIGNHQLLVGRIVPGEWLVVGVDRPDEWADQPPQQDTRRVEPAGSHVEGSGTMRHHLRDIHFPPLPLRCRLKLVDARDHLVDRIRLE